jgi:hypothetical protein
LNISFSKEVFCIFLSLLASCLTSNSEGKKGWQKGYSLEKKQENDKWVYLLKVYKATRV